MASEFPEKILSLLASHRFMYANEDELQRGIAKILDNEGISYEREFRISPQDRLDFLLPGGVDIETKIDGSAAELLRQVHRYTKSDMVTCVIVVTDKFRHSLPNILNGKSVFLHSLLLGAF